MSGTRKLIIALWILIGCLFLWWFSTYDQGTTQSAAEPPRQQHFWLTPSAALAPGESSTQTVSFLSRTGVTPGTNPNPKILFQTEKAKA